MDGVDGWYHASRGEGWETLTFPGDSYIGIIVRTDFDRAFA